MREALDRAVLASYVARLYQPAYVRQFAGLSEAEMDHVLQAFALKNCRPNQELIDVLKKHMARPA